MDSGCQDVCRVSCFARLVKFVFQFIRRCRVYIALLFLLLACMFQAQLPMLFLARAQAAQRAL